MLKIDLHAHDPEASWDSSATRKSMLRGYRRHNFDVVGFVGHDEMAGVRSDNLVVLNGIEHTISTKPEIHVVEFPDYGYKFLAHPRRITKLDTKDVASKIIQKRNLQGVEKYNNGVKQFSGDLSVPSLANSDAHNPFQIGTSFMLVDSPKTQGSVINAVRSGEAKAVNRFRRPLGKLIKYVDVALNDRNKSDQ